MLHILRSIKHKFEHNEFRYMIPRYLNAVNCGLTMDNAGKK
jgi:hypothetical protein